MIVFHIYRVIVHDCNSRGGGGGGGVETMIVVNDK